MTSSYATTMSGHAYPLPDRWHKLRRPGSACWTRWTTDQILRCSLLEWSSSHMRSDTLAGQLSRRLTGRPHRYVLGSGDDVVERAVFDGLQSSSSTRDAWSSAGLGGIDIKSMAGTGTSSLAFDSRPLKSPTDVGVPTYHPLSTRVDVRRQVRNSRVY